MRYDQSHFYDELNKMLAEAKTSGAATLRVVSKNLYDSAVRYVDHRVIDRDEQDECMEYACKAMWRLWEKQGYQKRK